MCTESPMDENVKMECKRLAANTTMSNNTFLNISFSGDSFYQSKFEFFKAGDFVFERSGARALLQHCQNTIDLYKAQATDLPPLNLSLKFCDFPCHWNKVHSTATSDLSLVFVIKSGVVHPSFYIALETTTATKKAELTHKMCLTAREKVSHGKGLIGAAIVFACSMSARFLYFGFEINLLIVQQYATRVLF